MNILQSSESLESGDMNHEKKRREVRGICVGKARERAESKGTYPLKLLWKGAVQQLVWKLRFVRRQVNLKESTAKVQFLCWKAV